MTGFEVPSFWAFVVLLVADIVIAWAIRRSGLEQAFNVIWIICFVLPIVYFLLDWNNGLMSGRYTLNDLPDKIKTVLAYGLGSAFSGGIIGYLIGKFNSDPFS